MSQAASPTSACAAQYVLPVALGIAAWLGVNGIFTELWKMDQPEGEKLASNVSLAVQFGNVGLVIAWLVTPCLGRYFSADSGLPLANLAILLLGFSSLALLSVTWSWTSKIPFELGDAGECSSWLIALAFLSAVSDGLSNLTFWPYAGRIGATAVTMLAAGETASTVVCSAFAWLQKLTGFSISVYFIILTATCGLCTLTFAALHLVVGRRVAGTGDGAERVPLQIVVEDGLGRDSASTALGIGAKRHYFGLSARVAWLAFIQNGLWFNVLPFAADAYQPTTGVDLYWLNSTLPQLCGPIASVAAVLVVARPARWTSAVVWNLAGLWMVVVGVAKQPWGGEAGAVFFSVLCVLGFLAIVYDKAALLTAERLAANSEAEAERALMWAGAAMQVGSVIGTFIFYMLINHTALFG